CIFGILCIALVLSSGWANVVCHKEGHCPDGKACFNYCVGLGFKQFGGLCTTQGINLCCCISQEPPRPPPAL
ncbi:hypothetical protein VIGAN_02160100, partial [Vigna angularis var. angularis]